MRVLKTSMLTAIACLSLCLAQTGFAADRPFKGHAEGVISFTSPTTAIVDMTGEATHLGRFTRHEHLTIDGPFVFGYIIFIAANGDELYVDFFGMFVSPNDAVGTYVFVGGTGRFKDATGEADFIASTPDFVNLTVTFEGTLNY